MLRKTWIALILVCLYIKWDLELHLPLKNLPPNHQFWFGTDELGRDLFTRVWIAAATSFILGVIVTGFNLILGTLIGSFASYKGGRIEGCLIRCFDLLQTVPHLLLLMVILTILSPKLSTFLLFWIVFGWIQVARCALSMAKQIQQRDFVIACKGMGGGFFWVLKKHLIPHMKGPLLASAILVGSRAIFSEVFLSFAGISSPSHISLGSLLLDGLNAMRIYPWRFWVPSLFIIGLLVYFQYLANLWNQNHDTSS